MIDLDKLAELVAAMTPGPYQALRPRHTGSAADLVFADDVPIADCVHASDAAGIVALRNAADELIRLARVGQAYVRRRRLQDADASVVSEEWSDAVLALHAAYAATEAS